MTGPIASPIVNLEAQRALLAPFLERLEVAEQKAEAWQARADALTREASEENSRRYAEHLKHTQERFRVNIATELMATSRQWAIEMQFESSDDFLRKTAKRCLRAADILLEEAATK